MQIKLRLVGGKNAGQEIAVNGPKFIVGRAEGCQMRPRSEAIADRHCQLLLEPGSVTVEDFGSPGGTFVNNARVTGKQELKPGDKLKIGPLEFEVVMSASLAAKKKPKVASVEDAAARMASSGRDEVDVSQWLDNDDAPLAPSRYAAKLSDEDKTAMGLGADGQPLEAKPATRPAVDKTGADETKDAAEKVLSKYLKRG
jgi:predicted component of type VI protein secretion system